ncbi:MAG: glycosyltransferase family 4 protein [Gemmatimonadaceae bacterium]
MLGRNAGYATSQSQFLAGRLASAGHQVIAVSSRLSRAGRLSDVVGTLVRNRKRVDVVIIDVFGGLSFVLEDVASLLGRRFGHRIILVLHGGAFPDFAARSPRWTRRVLNRADVVITPSEYLCETAKRLGYDAHVIPNTIDMAEYPYRVRDQVSPRLLWMRSYHPLYNPMMAVRVLARLRSVFSNATLVMAGADKGFEHDVRRVAAELDVSGAVRFAGFLDHEAKVREGDAADIYLNTNRVDNTPVSVIEACAMGLPVIATAVGGLAHMLRDGETGLLVPDDDDEAMAAAAQKLISDPSLAKRLSMNGRGLALRSHWQNVRPQWESVFRQVLAS